MDSDKEKFERLRDKWLEETSLSSRMDEICMNANYQTIIGMGEKAIPCIVEDWQTTDNHWFWALRCITEANPVPEEDKGRVVKMKEHWLKFLVVRSCEQ